MTFLPGAVPAAGMDSNRAGGANAPVAGESIRLGMSIAARDLDQPVAGHFRERHATRQPQRQVDVGDQVCEHFAHAFFAAVARPRHKAGPQQDASAPPWDGLEHVGAPTIPLSNNTVATRPTAFTTAGSASTPGDSAIELAPAVIGHDHTGGSVVHGLAGRRRDRGCL